MTNNITKYGENDVKFIEMIKRHYRRKTWLQTFFGETYVVYFYQMFTDKLLITLQTFDGVEEEYLIKINKGINTQIYYNSTIAAKYNASNLITCMDLIEYCYEKLDDKLFVILYSFLDLSRKIEAYYHLGLTMSDGMREDCEKRLEYYKLMPEVLKRFENILLNYAAKVDEAEERVLNNRPKLLKQLNEPAANEETEETFDKRKHRYLIMKDKPYIGKLWRFTPNYQIAFAIYLIEKFETTSKAIEWINRYEKFFDNKESLKKTVLKLKRKMPQKNNRQRQNYDEAVKEFDEFVDYIERTKKP